MSDIYRDSIFWVEIERISPNPFQPRKEFDEEKLKGLAESIRMYGLLQPLTVTRNEETKEDGGIVVNYELIAGERRLRASKIAGLTQIPVIIRSGEDTDQMKLELAIIENLQREDLNPVDKAKAFAMLQKNFNFTHAEIGKKVGKSREYVSNTLRLLSLPETILGYLAEGRIAEGHSRPLLMLKDKPEEQMVLAKEILLKKLTVRESEALARRSAQDKVTKRKYRVNPEIIALERKLTEKLGTRVQIEQKEVGGKVVISFFSADDLTNLLNNMRLESESAKVTESFNGNPDAPAEDLTNKVRREQEETHTVQPSPERPLPEENNIQDQDTDKFVKKENTQTQERFRESTEEITETKETENLQNEASSPFAEPEKSDNAFDTSLTSEKDTFESDSENVFKEEKTQEEPVFDNGSFKEKTPEDEVVSEEAPLYDDGDDDDLYSIKNFSI